MKTKVMFNLTKRQLLCFGGGALVGVPLFFLLKGSIGSSPAAICMILVMLPFFLLAMYEKNGQPLEKIVGNILKVCFLRPKQRPYMTNNFYDLLRRQENLDTVKGLHWSRNSRLQPIPIPEAVQSSAAFYDPAVDQDDILC